ncbi:hypothetical protein KIH39_07575 [Telmatocola sphagniphila]|uniref:PAS fold domain-containing protein n=1 Tax=Telmatocola sphagniphila TaxID=1123043 RepID=A0A8E6EWG1_9BACT|nr:PAS domain-containing protein [Telmatocola sphagniphila]QVL33757.1 hypothetical protein KIH39_07575 [Telmatocola sphagniphila]
MKPFTLRFVSFAFVPLATAAVWFVLPESAHSTATVFVLAGLATVILGGLGWYFGDQTDRLIDWVYKFRTDALGALPLASEQTLFDEIPKKFLECDQNLRTTRQEHRKDLETIGQWIGSLQGTMGLAAPTLSEKQSPMELLAKTLQDSGKHYQSTKARLNMMQKLLYGMPSPTIITDEQGQLKMLNLKAETLLGLNSTAMTSLKLDEVLSSSDSPISIWQTIKASASGQSIGTLVTPKGPLPVRLAFLKIPNAGREPLIFITLWERQAELEEMDAAVKSVRETTTQFILRESLLAELPLTESLQAKSRLVLADIKQKADRDTIVSRFRGLQQDLDALGIRLRLLEWLYRSEWTVPVDPELSEVSGEDAVQETAKLFAGVFASRRLNLNVVNQGGWLSVDKDTLTAALMGLLNFACKASSGDRLEVKIEKLPPTPELTEGWMCFTLSGEWQPTVWNQTASIDSLSNEALIADATLGLAVANRVARRLQGVCRAEESSDFRRCIKLYVPTRLPSPITTVSENEVGPREELCLGWKLASVV